MNLRKYLLAFSGMLLVLSLVFGTGRFRVSADNEDYGEEAWKYLQYIDAHHGYRVTDKTVTEDTAGKMNAGEWIRTELSAMGYEVRKLEWEHNENPIID